MSFFTQYPLTARALVFTPMAFRAGFPMLRELPWPSLNGIRDLARFAGISDSAVRTALARAKRRGELLAVKDRRGTTRFQMARSLWHMGMANIDREIRPDGFVLAVYSFTRDATRERSRVRETLHGYGFRRLAQNTYINGRIDTSGLRRTMGELRLNQNVYLFHCPDIDDADLIRRIMTLFDLESRAEELRVFRDALVKWLSAPTPGGVELARRILYVGPLHYDICRVKEPPIPARYLPAGYPLSEIREFYGRITEENRDGLIRYYRGANE